MRSFGTEIASNSNAMAAVSQQTVQIMQGKLKPNQVAKKGFTSYRTNAGFVEKPLSAFASQTSLNPLAGPGQKLLNQGTGSQAQLLKKSKSNLQTEMIAQQASQQHKEQSSKFVNLTARGPSHMAKTMGPDMLSGLSAAGKETPIIKLTQIEKVKTAQQAPTGEDESKGDVSDMQLSSDDDTELMSGRQSQTEQPKTADPQLPVSEVYKQRLAAWRKQMSKGLIFADQLEMRNPQMIAEHANEIYKNIREEENTLKIDPDYLTKVQVQTEVKDTSRAFLIEWIIDVHRKFRLLPETLYVTVFIIDRFLSLKQIKKSQLHILGVTSLLISTKYEEIYPPELKDLLTVSENKFTKAEVLQMEKDILLTLQFDLTAPSAYRFLERFRRISSIVGHEEKVFFFAQYLQEIALLDASLLKYKASELAAAALILAAKSLKKVNVWNKEMEKAT